MFGNTRIERWALSTQSKLKKRIANQTVPNESTPLHTVANKGTQAAVPVGTDGLPVVAITSASMEFISDAAQNDQRTLTVTGSDYGHMLQPQTSATPSNISDQTMATDTTAGSEMNLLPAKSNASLNEIVLPTSDAPDIDDAGLEEITINPAVTIPSSTFNEHQEVHLSNKGLEKHEISNHNYNGQNHVADIEATLDNGTVHEEPEDIKFPWERPDGGFFVYSTVI
jgi:hypothetical protein